MPVRAKCQVCGAVITFPDRMVGVEGICSQCKSPIVASVPERKSGGKKKKKKLRFRRRRRR